MIKLHLAAGLAAAALMTASAVAQTPAPSASGAAPAAQSSAAAGQLMAQMPQGMMRASDLKGVDVYGSDNQRIGDIDEMIVDRQGKIHAIVVGVGGFLGIGQKDVAIPFDRVEWMTQQQVQAQNNQNNQNQAATTGSTGAAGAAGSGNMAAPTGAGSAGTTGTAGNTGMAAAPARDSNVPARAMVKMTKADLQNAPEFRYSANEANRSGAAGGAPGTPAPRQP